MNDPDELFLALLRQHAPPAFALRPRVPEDEAFLVTLLDRTTREAAARLAGAAASLPTPLLELQLRARDRAYRARFPGGVEHIIVDRGWGAIGSVFIDWCSDGGGSTLVDIAVLPEGRRGGIGLHVLRAWVGACDAQGRDAHLHVMPHNPARRLYRRLGFVEAGEPSFPVAMSRRPRHAGRRA